MNTINKICTCFWCYQWACSTAQCIDIWHAYEACGLADIECGHCCWALCAPICHECKMGDAGYAGGHCMKCVKYCLYSCALCCCAPIDGCYNCLLYIKAVCTQGVTGFADIMKNVKFMNEKIKNAFELENGTMPDKALNEYKP